MKQEISGFVFVDGIEYEYTALVYSGDDSNYYQDKITDLMRTDGEDLDDDKWEDVEFIALQNAHLLEWCEKEGWAEEDTGTGCSALTKTIAKKDKICITRQNDPVAPQTMGEPVVMGQYDNNEQLIGEARHFKGGINEWLSENYERGNSAYAPLIMRTAKKLGHPNVNPRWVEAFMRLEYPSLNGVSSERFDKEVKIAIECIDAVGPVKSERCAKSFGL